MTIVSEIKQGLLEIQINRPERKNAFTNDMYTAIGDAFRDATQSHQVKAILLKGHKDCFSAGNDIGDFMQNPPTDLEAPVFRFLRMISTCPKPIVAQVEGMAVGIGTTMLLHCDLVYAAETSKFSMPFVKLGMCPEGGSTLIVPQLAGYQKAAELLLLGDVFSAAKASECGIVTQVLPADQLEAHVNQQVKKLLNLPVQSLIKTKSLLKSHLKNALPTVLEVEGVGFMNMLKQAPAQEAFKAFAEKRAPDFLQFEGQSPAQRAANRAKTQQS